MTKVKCPYCEFEIDNEIERCPNCKELFKTPSIEGIRFTSVYLFLVTGILLSCLGLGWALSCTWLIINFKIFLSISNNKDSKKLKILSFLFLTSALFSVLFKPLLFVVSITHILLSYRILRIIEKYSYRKYNSPVTHHEIGMLIFGFLYVVYYLDTYSERINDPKRRYIMTVENLFKYILSIGILLLFLYFLSVLCSVFILK